ncbi:MAG: hypothetical protein R3C56_23275 [Pirellulaceae bacterium]
MSLTRNTLNFETTGFNLGEIKNIIDQIEQVALLEWIVLRCWRRLSVAFDIVS